MTPEESGQLPESEIEFVAGEVQEALDSGEIVFLLGFTPDGRVLHFFTKNNPLVDAHGDEKDVSFEYSYRFRYTDCGCKNNRHGAKVWCKRNNQGRCRLGNRPCTSGPTCP